MKLLTVILFTLGYIPLLFEGGDNNLANFAYDACTIPMVPIVLIYLFNQIDKTKILDRGLIAVLIIAFSAKFINYLSFMLSAELGFIIYLITMFFSYLTLAMVCTWKDEKSDNIEPDGTYFVFKRPKNFLDFVVSLFRLPISSFAIIQNDKWYKFSRENKGLYISDISGIDINEYIFKRAPDIDSDILKTLIGTQWKIKSSNCITAFQPVLSIMGIKLKYFDFIPSVFAYRFFKQ